MSRRLLTLALACALALPGCMVTSIHSNKAVGEINSVGEARQLIRPGMSMEQVRSKLGEPTATFTQNNRTVWSYAHAQTDWSGKRILIPYGAPPNTKSITVTFNTGSRVSRVDYSEVTH